MLCPIQSRLSDQYENTVVHVNAARVGAECMDFVQEKKQLAKHQGSPKVQSTMLLVYSDTTAGKYQSQVPNISLTHAHHKCSLR